MPFVEIEGDKFDMFIDMLLSGKTIKIQPIDYGDLLRRIEAKCPQDSFYDIQRTTFEGTEAEDYWDAYHEISFLFSAPVL